MDVVVDEVIAVLEVLAFGDAVGPDEDVDLVGIVGHDCRLFLRERREKGEQGLKIVAAAKGGFGSLGSGHSARVEVVGL